MVRAASQRESAQTVGVLVKAIEVLHALAATEEPIGPTDIAGRTGLDRSAVQRILTTLSQDRLIERVDDTGTYRLGLGLAALGLTALRRLDFRHAARPHMESLYSQFGETVNLGVIDGDSVLYIDMLESQHSLRLAAVTGSRDPIVTTALGKSMLAYYRPEQLQPFLAARPTSSQLNITTDALLAELAEIREQGYAVDDEVNEIGAFCIGAPIFGLVGDVLGAISVSVPIARMNTRRKKDLIVAVKASSAQISASMGWKADQ